MCSHNCFRVFEKLWRESLQAIVAAATTCNNSGNDSGNRVLSKPASSAAVKSFHAKLSKAFDIDETYSSFPMKRKRKNRRKKRRAFGSGTLHCQSNCYSKQKSSFVGDKACSNNHLRLRSVVR